MIPQALLSEQISEECMHTRVTRPKLSSFVRSSLHYFCVSIDIFFFPIRKWIGHDKLCTSILWYTL